MPNENNNQDERVKKVEDFLLDPEKVVFESLEEFKGAVQTLVEALAGVDLSALATLKGTDGVTPKRGVDYMNEADIAALQAFLLDNIPVIGVDLPSREQVEAFIKAQVAKIPRVKGDKGEPGTPGKRGKDGSPDSAEDIITKIRTLRGKNQMLQTGDIRGLDAKLRIYDDAVDEVASIRKTLDSIYLATSAPAGGGGTPGAAEWGAITGTLSDQTDLQAALDAKQALLVSGTNIKTINSTSLLGSGDIAVQAVLVSGTNIKTINSTTLLGSGDLAVQAVLVSGTNIKSINGTSLLGSGDITIGGSVAWGAITGTLSAQTDLQTALDAKVNLSQAVGQTIGATGARLTKLWAVDITVTNAITGSVTGNAGTATALQNARTIGGVSFDGTANITVATATGGFTVSGGDLALGANSITMTGSIGTTGSRVLKGWFTDLQVTNAISGSVTGNAATATALQNARTIGGVSFDGTTNITVATATGGFTVSGGNLALGTNSITMSGSIGVTGTRVTKLWATDIESSNMPTVGGVAILSSLTAPVFTTQSAGDNSTKVATTAYADRMLPLAGGTMAGNITLGENSSIALDPAGSADGKYTGLTVTGTGGATIAFGDVVYLDASTSRWKLTDADAAATAGPVMVAIAVTSSTDGTAITVLLQGIIRADAKFPTLTIGAAVYLGETAGAVQTAIPTGADNIIRVLGFALTADEMYFNPSVEWQVTVA